MAEHITIGDVAPRIRYVANGVVSTFSYPFAIFAAEDLEVYLGATRQVTGYTVAGAGNSAGGSVTFAIAPVAATIVTLRRRRAIKRLTDFQEGGEFRAKTINDELDILTAVDQQIGDDLTRALRLDATDADVSMVLPPAAQRAGRYLGFDAAGAPSVQQVAGKWRGVWGASIAYVAGDLATVPDASSNVHVCLGAHTSGVFATDLAAGHWALAIDVANLAAQATSAVNLAQEVFAGTGAQTAYTLAYAPGSQTALLVTVNNVVQKAGTSYTIAGTTLNFAVAPANGADVVVRYLAREGVYNIVPTAGDALKFVRANAAGNGLEFTASGGGGGTGAPTSAQYLVLANDGDLTGERRVVLAARLAGSDAGANSTYTIDLASGIVTPGTYTKLTVDTYGRVTAGATLSAGDLPAHSHAAGDITSGTLALVRGGTGANLSGTGGTNQFVKQTSAGGALSVGTITAGELPAHTHAASDIASGQVALARGGSGADLSATGGAGQYVKQSSAGGALSVGAIAAADYPTMVGDAGSGGTKGAVPAPASGDAAKYLKGDGTWGSPSGSGAPSDASYVVIGLNASLSAERRLQVGTGLTLSDAGANGDVTLGRNGQSRVATPAFNATMTFDWSTADDIRVSLTGNITTLTMSGATDGQRCTLEAAQDATGGRTIAWPANVRFSSDLPSPTLTATGSKMDRLLFIYNATAAKYDFAAIVKGY